MGLFLGQWSTGRKSAKPVVGCLLWNCRYTWVMCHGWLLQWPAFSATPSQTHLIRFLTSALTWRMCRVLRVHWNGFPSLRLWTRKTLISAPSKLLLFLQHAKCSNAMVNPSVCPSVTLRYCVKTREHRGLWSSLPVAELLRSELPIE